MVRRWLLVFILVFASSGSAFSLPLSSDRYDAEIKSAVRKFWPDFPDWRWWKAQLYQESLLEPDAVSRAGARGLAQFMPKTWVQIATELQMAGANPHQVRPAIQAGAYYMARLRRSWSAPRPEFDRHYLALASYNAGLGNILKAQRACGGRSLYDEIAACLPAITGRYSAETLTYVERIRRWRTELGGDR